MGPDLMKKISRLATSLVTSSICITFTYPLPFYEENENEKINEINNSCTTSQFLSPYFKIIETIDLPMSWGLATCYIQERV